MSEIKVEYQRRWDDRIKYVLWRLGDRIIAQANRRVGEGEIYDFFGSKLTPDHPRVWRQRIDLDQCTTEVQEHLERAHLYGFPKHQTQRG